ncbi:CocE/NonD family hydrolase [Halomonas shantousis]
MQHIDDFPHQVRETENLFIPMPDGTRLAARLWLPQGAEQVPVPAILEYLPYRKRDLTRARDQHNLPYLAGHGYACLRVDIRGSGDSDGVINDEYSEDELDDGVELIRWISEQPWCNGRVGMMGKSWGGFNSLLIAARRPPALKAVISVSASDDRYEDNMHYMGGCLLGNHLTGAAVMFAHLSLPPDPRLVGERWRELWQRRLENTGGWLSQWLRHQRRDDYWKHGSLCEDYSRVACPVFAISGWADGFTDVVFRLMEHLEVPRRAIIGAWGHHYPNEGVPGPAAGFLQEALHWWDHWLKDRDTGIMDEPMLRFWMQDSLPPYLSTPEYPGHWVGEPCWPSPNIRERRYRLGQRCLVPGDEPTEERGEPVRSPLSLGMFGGRWAATQALPDMAGKQRWEDGGALLFDSDPLPEALDICGRPRVTLDICADQPVAQVAVRLIDVLPDGESGQIAFGVFNLTHRDSHEHPEPLIPGERYSVTFHLHSLGQRIPAGHRLRVAITSSYFPVAWLPPKPVTLTVFSNTSSLALPERPPRPEDDDTHVAEPPEGALSLRTEQITPPHKSWEVKFDQIGGWATQDVCSDRGLVHMLDIDLGVRLSDQEIFRCQREDFASAVGIVHTQRELRHGDWNVRVDTRTKLTSNEEEFRVHLSLDAYEDDERVFSRNWHERIPRDLL